MQDFKIVEIPESQIGVKSNGDEIVGLEKKDLHDFAATVSVDSVKRGNHNQIL